MASLADPVYQLRKVGRDISKSFVNKLPRELTRCCFICVNSYRSFRQNIGVTPIQDAASLAKCVKYFEYEVFFVHNPHARTFIEDLNHFFEVTTEHLIVYYVGQGTTPQDLDRTIPRSYDEAFTFDDGAIDDEEFLDSLVDLKNRNSKVTLITDTCRPNTAWNIPGPELKGRKLPPGIVTLSAVPTLSSSQQMMALCQSQGIFTFNLTKELKANPKITVAELGRKMEPVLGEFAQEFKVGASSPELLDGPAIILPSDFAV